MSSKYIIKNCPAIYGISLDGCKKDHYEDGTVLCQDCTDCLLKQIVDKCEEKYHKSSNIVSRVFATEILQLLDMQEVE